MVNLKDITNIPNMICVFRIICVPIFSVLCMMGYIYWATGVFFVAAISDLFDGMIARKFNMCTDLGAILDPFADKFMHIMAVISLGVIGFLNPILIGLIVFKELLQVILVMCVKKQGIVIPANYYGKVPSAMLSLAVVLAFFTKLSPIIPQIVFVLLIAVTILAYIAFIQYVYVWYQKYKTQKNLNGIANE